MQSSTFTAKINLALADKLKKDLQDQQFELTQPPYTLFSGKKEGVSCTLYQSGSLVVQGKKMKDFIEFYLEPEILKEFHFSHPIAHLDMTPRIGMDEAGKGDFFGPLCVAAVYSTGEGIQKLSQMGVKDSKNCSDDSIFKMAPKIRSNFSHTIISLFPVKYNELYSRFKNLNRLLGWAHVAALSEQNKATHCKKAILDQFAAKHVVEAALKQKVLEIDLEQRVRGEEDIVVAAASILARAAFLEGLQALSKEYEIALPKGAGPGILKTGIKLVVQYGPAVLEKVGKLHFKTTQEILAQI